MKIKWILMLVVCLLTLSACRVRDVSNKVSYKPIVFSNDNGNGLVVGQMSTCYIGNDIMIVYDKNMRERYTRQFPNNRINSYVLTDNDELIIGLEDGKVIQINLVSDKQEKVEEFFAPIRNVGLSADERFVTVIAKNNAVLFIERKTKRIVMLNYDQDVLDIAVDQSSEHFYIQLPHKVIVFNDEQKKVVREYPLVRQ